MIGPDDANPYAPPETERTETRSAEARSEELGSAEAVLKEQIRTQTILRVMSRTWVQLAWASIAFSIFIGIIAAQYRVVGLFSALPGLAIAPFLAVAGFGLKRFRPWSRTAAIVAVRIVWLMLALEGIAGWLLVFTVDLRLFALPVIDNAVGIAAIAGGIVLASGPLTLMTHVLSGIGERIIRAGEALLPLGLVSAVVASEVWLRNIWASQIILTVGALAAGCLTLRLGRFLESPAIRSALSSEERARIGRLAAYEVLESIEEKRRSRSPSAGVSAGARASRGENRTSAQ